MYQRASASALRVPLLLTLFFLLSPPLVRAQPPGDRTIVLESGTRVRVTVVPDEDEPEADVGVALEEATARAARERDPDQFLGTARRAAKVSIADVPQIEQFPQVRDLLADLPSDARMRRLDIPSDATSDRVELELRNVRVMAFLAAAKGEDDNDFHLILCDRRQRAGRRCMTAELAGLPPSDSAAHDTLAAAREAFRRSLGGDTPGENYDRYDPPIPVEVTGSLFFDVSHRAGVVGPTGLRPPTAWEIHPVTRIRFEP
jgi:hypothetical protein